MILPETCNKYQRLDEGAIGINGIYDPAISLKQIYYLIQLYINNDEIIIMLPDDAYDLENIEEINPNYPNRIFIPRDCKYK